MNKKGQMEVGGILIAAITIIVGVILFTAIAQEVGGSTNTVAINTSLATTVNGTTQYLTDYRALSSAVITNETGGVILISGTDYTLTNNVLHPTTGALTVSILPSANSSVTSAWIVTGDAQPLDYIADSAGRAIAGLIAVFFALAIAVVAMTPALKSGLLDLIGKN